MKQVFNIAEVKYQLVPPHVHRRNAVERAIRTFKNHLITGLCICDTKFPAKEWDLLIPQAAITINLLRSSRRNPSLSAYTATYGSFNFNVTPLSPLGTRTTVHLKPNKLKSWGVHGVDAWYIGPSMDHYQCVKCFIPETGTIRDTDTVELFPQQVPFPQVSNETFLRQAASDIIAILQAPTPTIPSLTYGDTTMNAFIEIATILQRVAPPQFPKEIRNIADDTSQPRVAPTLTPENPLTLPSENETEPRVTPTAVPPALNILPPDDAKQSRVSPIATPIAPHIILSDNISEPRVHPTAVFIQPRINIAPIHISHINTPLPRQIYLQLLCHLPIPNFFHQKNITTYT